MSERDAGTVLPLLVLGFLLGTMVLAAATAGTAALVARRELAAICDGAALAGATALDRTVLADPTGPDPAGPDGAGLDPAGLDSAGPAGAGTDPAGTSLATGSSTAQNPYVATVLPLDRRAVVGAVEDYLGPGTEVAVGTDGRTVTVRCRRIVRVPFGAVLGRPQGIERTAVSRARSRIRPST